MMMAALWHDGKKILAFVTLGHHVLQDNQFLQFWGRIEAQVVKVRKVEDDMNFVRKGSKFIEISWESIAEGTRHAQKDPVQGVREDKFLIFNQVVD